MTIQFVSVGNNTNRSLIDFYHYLNKKFDAKKEIVEALCINFSDNSINKKKID